MEHEMTGEAGREPATVRVTPEGPFELQGDFRLVVGDQQQHVSHARLCRCGQSGNRPFCDSSHDRCPAPPTTDGFESNLEDAQGPVEVRISERGAIRFNGPVQVLDEQGRVLMKRQRCLLCGCGASRQQPVCDGTHNRIG
jgi:CDGSH-type Zn-finger protein